MQVLTMSVLVLTIILVMLQPVGSISGQGVSPPHLATWNEQDADGVVVTMRALADRQRSFTTREYQRQVAFAAAEAIRRFPYAPQRTAWQREQAYSLYLAGDILACQQYAQLYEGQLNDTQPPPSQLDDWFAKQEPRLSVEVNYLDAQAGLSGALLVELGGFDLSPLFFFVSSNVRNVYRVWPVCEGRPIEGGRYVFSEWQLADLTGDGREELIVADFGQRSARFDLTAYRLSYSGLTQLGIPVPAGLVNVRWRVEPQEGSGRPARILVEGVLNLNGGCPVPVSEQYEWNNTRLQTITASADLAGLSLYPRCAEDYFQRVLNRFAGGDSGTLEQTRSWVESYPHNCRSGQQSHPFSKQGCPPDVRDEARFQIALSLAEGGSVNLAQHEMRAISDSPSSPDSNWIVPARSFTRWYGSQSSFGRACQAAGRCYPYINIERILRSTSTDYRAQLVNVLQANGVPVLLAGLTDIDQNRLNEHWFTVTMEDPVCGDYCPVELWMVVQSNRRFWGYPLALVDPDTPVEINNLSPIDSFPIFSIEGHVGQPVAMVRSATTGAVDLVPLCDLYQQRLDALENTILRGNSLLQANRSLEAWAVMDLSECPPGTMFSTRPRLAYLHALSYELLGNESQAASLYAALAREETGSQFAAMAQARLQKEE